MKKITLIDKAFFLKKTPLFQVLDLDLLLPIADKLGFATFDADRVIFNRGDDAHLIYLIYKGCVKINEHGVELNEENFFGDESLFSGDQRLYTVTAKSELKTLTLSRSHLLRIIAECPSVALGFLQVYCQANPFMKQIHKETK